MQESVGFGLIGCGVMGKVHAITFEASPSVRFVTACDQSEDRAEQFATEHGAEKHVANWREVIEDPDIQAVAIVTPDFAHEEIVHAAIAAGKDVLVEKPLATTVEACERIVEAHRKQGGKLMVNFANRWNIPFVNLSALLRQGKLGDLQMINIRLNDTRFVPEKMLSWSDRSSPAHFLGSHVVDLVRWISGAEVARVYSVSRSVVLKQAGIDTPDFFQSIVELTSGATAVIENCWIVNESSPNVYDFQCEFVGSRGSVYVNTSHHGMITTYTDDGMAFPDVSGAPMVYGKPVGFAVASIEHFIDCVISDSQPIVTAEDGLRAAEAVAAMDESARTRQAVVLRD
jgi:predicted dehydrogenase